MINKNDHLNNIKDFTDTKIIIKYEKEKSEKNESNSNPKPKTIDDIRMKEQYEKNVIKNPIKREYYEINEKSNEDIKEKNKNNDNLKNINENIEEIESDGDEIEFEIKLKIH